MAQSSIPAVLDYLVANIAGLGLPGVIVSDGFTNKRGDAMVLVGVSDESGDSSSVQEWAAIGNNAQTESYDVPCLITCFSGSVSAKVPRDKAFAILTKVSDLILTDPSLADALHGWAHISDVRLTQTNDPEQASEGRRASVYFTVHVENRLTARSQ